MATVFSGSCAAPGYVPEISEIDVSNSGSYINVSLRNNAGSGIKGELIAVDQNGLLVLTSFAASQKRLMLVPRSEIIKYQLRYAQPKHYGWTIPVFTLGTLPLGLLWIITGPVNLAVTTLVTISGENDFKYNQHTMPFERLHMFARFPQGIPPNVDISSIQ